MPFNFRAAVLAALLVASAAAVRAEPADGSRLPASPPAAASAAAPAGTTAGATAAAPGYRSAFEGYRSLEDPAVRSWRQANDLVGQIGGWQAYAREGQGEAPAGSVSSGSGTSGSARASGSASASGSACAPAMRGMSGMSGMSKEGVPETKPPGAAGRVIAPSRAASAGSAGHKMP